MFALKSLMHVVHAANSSLRLLLGPALSRYKRLHSHISRSLLENRLIAASLATNETLGLNHTLSGGFPANRL